MATNFYLQLQSPNIAGESTDSQHTQWIEVLSWSHSFNQPAKPTRSGTGGGTVEKANHSDFSITKYVDSATDDLLKACWSGNQIGTGTFEAYRADGNNQPVLYLEVVMEDIIVSNVSFGGGGGDLPTETVGLSYGKVTYTYTPQADATGMPSSSGPQPVSHDLMLNEVC
jgi:type VI secretion system secreted protein Hcp